METKALPKIHQETLKEPQKTEVTNVSIPTEGMVPTTTLLPDIHKHATIAPIMVVTAIHPRTTWLMRQDQPIKKEANLPPWALLANPIPPIAVLPWTAVLPTAP